MFRFNFTEDVEDKPLSSTDNITANFMGGEIKKNDTFNDTFVEHQFNDLVSHGFVHLKVKLTLEPLLPSFKYFHPTSHTHLLP